ncbi:hypothetical protein F9U64_19010 [Gracilibacillus oryzae]|uniref:Uncharacterized protein n=1 Tax=Gracilibacillus oryzae TaxID=1672701 RepID=A0A7C8GRC8_9BACI|nr:hypothetical protein [Gracilibacillus oryzae]KAB8126912.1 hypothetical protein F9U64_19010 [Gracilibacillus oryzae]
MIILEAVKPIFMNGRVIEPGNIFSCDPIFAKKLVHSKSANIQNKTSPTSMTKSYLESKTREELFAIIKKQKIDGINESARKPAMIEAILKEESKNEL